MNHEIHEIHESAGRQAPSSLRSALKYFVYFVYFVIPIPLAGCGFTPLYAAPSVVSNLASIDVDAPQGRAGFLMRQHLDDAFGKNRAGPAAYKMQLALSETRYARGTRTDNVATRYEYVLTANYTLASLPSGALAKKGQVRVELTYDSADQPYASIAAQQDAEDRATEEAARRIQLELAAWMATGEPKADAPKAAKKG
jgi:LPS-assembly lipoprotein